MSGVRNIDCGGIQRLTGYDMIMQLKSEFGGDRCFGILANMDFMLECTYEKDGENQELLIYKKR